MEDEKKKNLQQKEQQDLQESKPDTGGAMINEDVPSSEGATHDQLDLSSLDSFNYI